MDLHTRLTVLEVTEALRAAQRAGRVAGSVEFVELGTALSRINDRRIALQLGTYEKDSLLPGAIDRRGNAMHVRKFKNSGSAGASQIWAVTWHETGWFIREVLAADPGARFSIYKGWEDFHRQTHGEFLLPGDSPVWRSRALADAEAVLAANREQLATAADGTWVNHLNP